MKFWGRSRRPGDANGDLASDVAPTTDPTESVATYEDDESPSGPGPWRIVKAAASVITPVTLITGLMYYFGLIHAYSFFGGFGVDYTVFELTPEDYILRSADGLFLPFCVAALGVPLASSIFQMVVPRVGPTFTDRFIRTWTIPSLLLGLGLTAMAGIAFLRPYWLYDYPGLGGLALVFGVLLFTSGIRSVRWLASRHGRSPRRPPTSWAVAEWAAVIMLVSVGLFWAVGDFSARVGSQRAEQVVRALPTWPSVVLHSEQPLNLDDPGVNETVCAAGEDAFAYRYDGLTLITQEGGQLLLLPRTWTANKGTAIVLSKTDSLLLQFSLGVTNNTSTC